MSMSVDQRRISPSSERNVAAIGDVLAKHFKTASRLLEIGSGTGQHAAGCIGRLPGLSWQPTDKLPESSSIAAWAAETDHAERILAARRLDVSNVNDWKQLTNFDAAFTANTLHIMSWSSGQQMFQGVSKAMVHHGVLAVYGPFHDAGEPTSDGNRNFDAQLRADGGDMGIRDLQDVQAAAAQAGFLQIAHFAMPANNQMIIWRLHRQ